LHEKFYQELWMPFQYLGSSGSIWSTHLCHHFSIFLFSLKLVEKEVDLFEKLIYNRFNIKWWTWEWIPWPGNC